MFKKDWMLSLLVTIISLLLTLAAARLFMPHLLGSPVDLQLVKVDREVPPFFDGVFRDEDRTTKEWMIPDPYIKRQRPFYPDEILNGPHDLLGFRNRAIPNRPDIITIGDSQTYGSNASLDDSWPMQLKQILGDDVVLYSMASHGWGAFEYLEIFKKAVFFSPKIVIIAFYTGNDPAETFRLAYGDEHWKSYRLDSALSSADYPTVTWPPPPSEQKFLQFRNGGTMGFTPAVRLNSNKKHPAVKTAYGIMTAVAEQIGELARAEKVTVLFTVIPSKELVYAERFRLEGTTLPQDYAQLVKDESGNIATLAERLAQIKECRYLDLVKDMQQAALADTLLYKETADGHPVAAGYNLIARLLSVKVSQELHLGGDPRELKILKGIAATKENQHKLLELAQSYTTAQNFPNAIFTYEKYLALEPNDIESMSYLGAVHFQSGDTAKAMKIFDQVLKEQPGHEKTLFNKGIVFLNLKQKDNALKMWREILKINPQATDPNGVPLGVVIDQLARQP